MSQQSKIQWTDATWNIVTGCSKVSAGCKHCYAERIWKRVYPFRAFTNVALHPERLIYPRHWKKPRRIFVNSLSDLFHESLDEAAILSVFAAMFEAPWHVYQILTKRPERMRTVVRRICEEAHLNSLPPHFWMGVSVENADTLDERLPLLVQTQARTRWISAEPLLVPLEFGFLGTCPKDWNRGYSPVGDHIHWVVVGGESGPKSKARPFCLSWARDIVRQCKEARIPVFVKQLGSNPVNDLSASDYSGDGRVGDGTDYFDMYAESMNRRVLHLRDSHGGDMSEWPEELRVRQYPNGTAR